VDEQDAAQVTLNQDVTVKFTSQPGKEYPATVVRVAPSLERPADSPGNARVLRIKVEWKDKVEELRPGLEADVEGRTVLARGGLLLPRSAVYKQDGQDCVMGVVGGRTRTLPVRLGAVTSFQAEVTEGVSEGTLVLAEGKDGLKDGERVRTRNGNH
ncbi:MAG: HlyD family efflux transporter periplasmic adaptor subunit, partial [Candidatus Eremiobacterota bacterium]